MSYTKRIVCFANSRKLTGRCVAGREWTGSNYGNWIRPVSARERGELTSERWYDKTWHDPRLLDIIELTLSAYRPSGCQTENHVVDRGRKWKFLGRVAAGSIDRAIDHPNGPLWVNGDSTVSGHNDRVPAGLASREDYSLTLIQPAHLTLVIGTETQGRRRVRGQFALAGHDYSLVVTDPVIEQQFRKASDGMSINLDGPVLCISLSETFPSQNASYKLIAAVIPR